MTAILIDTNGYSAASALQHGYALYSHDEHFSFVDGLIVGKTAADFMLL